MVRPPVRVDDIDYVAPHIMPYLEALYRNGGENPDDLISDLKNGILHLHSIPQVGFFIASWSLDECFVVVGQAIEGTTLTGICDIISETAEYAKQQGCSKLSFRSDRKGWARVVKKLGFTIDGDTFTKAI